MQSLRCPFLGCKVDAMLFAVVFNEAGDVLCEALQEPSQRHANRLSLFMKLADEEAGIEIVETAQEHRWSLDIDLPSLQGRRR